MRRVQVMRELRLRWAKLDSILGLQLTVAWAGEAAGGRLGWWGSDLVDRAGGGDLWRRLTPRSGTWIGLRMVREAARVVDSTLLARSKPGFDGRYWTPFHLGFELDEQLDDRLKYHLRKEHDPAKVFGARFLVHRPWSVTALERALRKLGTPAVEATPAGRRVEVAAASPIDAAPLLFAALLPLGKQYPMPYVEHGGAS
jgi:hypothetical protein